MSHVISRLMSSHVLPCVPVPCVSVFFNYVSCGCKATLEYKRHISYVKCHGVCACAVCLRLLYKCVMCIHPQVSHATCCLVCACAVCLCLFHLCVACYKTRIQYTRVTCHVSACVCRRHHMSCVICALAIICLQDNNIIHTSHMQCVVLCVILASDGMRHVCSYLVCHVHSHSDRKKPPPPGGISMYLCSLIKDRE